jgi:hypothetical protein
VAFKMHPRVAITPGVAFEKKRANRDENTLGAFKNLPGCYLKIIPGGNFKSPRGVIFIHPRGYFKFTPGLLFFTQPQIPLFLPF